MVMEMDPDELGHDGDHPLSQGSPDMNDIFGDPQVLPRIGEEYQVEIPPLRTESEHLQLMKNPADTELTADQSFLMGLPIPITWVHEEVDNINDERLEFLGDSHVRLGINVMVESEKSKEMHINLDNKDSKIKVELLDYASDNRKASGELKNGEQAVVLVMDMDLPVHQHPEPSLDQMYSNRVDHASTDRKASGELKNAEQAVVLVMDMNLPVHQHPEPSLDQMYSNRAHSPQTGRISFHSSQRFSGNSLDCGINYSHPSAFDSNNTSPSHKSKLGIIVGIIGGIVGFILFGGLIFLLYKSRHIGSKCDVFVAVVGYGSCRENKNLTRTARYASMNTHLGIGM